MSVRSSLLFLQQPSNLARFGMWTGYFYTINAVIGAGFLTLPHAFQATGWLYGYIFMLLVSIEVYYISLLLIDSMSRAECFSQLEELGISPKPPTFSQILKGTYEAEVPPADIQPMITDRRFDLSTMISQVLGRKFGVAYMVFLYLCLTGCQVSYNSIFATSFSSIVPLGFADTCNIYSSKAFIGNCRLNYWFYLCVYTAIMMYLTIRGLKEQQWLQSIMTLMRFIIIFLIFITCIALIASGSNIKNSKHEDFKMPPLITTSGMLTSLPNIIFAFIYQMQLPSISEFVKDKHVNLKKIILLVGITTLSVYSLVAIVVPIAIHDVSQQCSINYADYSAGYSQSQRPWWTYVISYIIVLFPAIDVFSCFPLTAATVADNLITLTTEASNEDFSDPTRQLTFRIVSVIVPAMISFFVFNLGLIIGWVGMITFLLVPISIPILHIYLREMINARSAYEPFYYNKVIKN